MIQLTQNQKQAIEKRSLMSFYDIDWDQADALVRCKEAAKAQASNADRRWESRFEREFVREVKSGWRSKAA